MVRCFIACCVILLILLVTGSGCLSDPSAGKKPPADTATLNPQKTSAGEGVVVSDPVSSTGTRNSTGDLAAVRSNNPIWDEAYRMFRNIRATEYVHPPYTSDDATGDYQFDCLGFVDHVLMNADMPSYRAIGKNFNPSIGSYSAYFTRLDSNTPKALGWTRVPRPVDLRPGDICLWLKPSTLDTGHMWIIAGEPEINPKRGNEVMVRIFDSTGTAHSSDTRTGSPFRTGLGSGILGYMVDNTGNPVGLYWEGGESTGAGEKDTTIVCGRLNR